MSHGWHSLPPSKAPCRGTTSNDQILNLDMSEHSRFSQQNFWSRSTRWRVCDFAHPCLFWLIYCIYIWYVYIANIYIYIYMICINHIKNYLCKHKQGICWWSELNPRNMLEEISDGAQGLWLKEFSQSSGLKGTKELLVSIFPIFPY